MLDDVITYMMHYIVSKYETSHIIVLYWIVAGILHYDKCVCLCCMALSAVIIQYLLVCYTRRRYMILHHYI